MNTYALVNAVIDPETNNCTNLHANFELKGAAYG